MLKKLLKRMLLFKKGIYVDNCSDINYKVRLSDEFKKAEVKDSILHITSMGTGCTFEHVISYGDVRLGKFVSISGPGTVLHAEDGKIQIGNFCSIAQNVTIQQFNHNLERPTTYAMQYKFFSKVFKDDVTCKGDVLIEDDVWIGSNAVILSGVKIGRGAVIAAGAVVTKDVESYAIVGGIPAKKIKMRFTEDQIKILEESKWWMWDIKRIYANKKFFLNKVGTMFYK